MLAIGRSPATSAVLERGLCQLQYAMIFFLHTDVWLDSQPGELPCVLKQNKVAVGLSFASADASVGASYESEEDDVAPFVVLQSPREKEIRGDPELVKRARRLNGGMRPRSVALTGGT